MTRLSSLLPIFSLLALVGCQTANSTDLIFTQTPPAVQAAFAKNYDRAVIKTVTRSTMGNQDYFTFKFTGNDGTDHTVKMNEAGDEIENH